VLKQKTSAPNLP